MAVKWKKKKKNPKTRTPKKKKKKTGKLDLKNLSPLKTHVDEEGELEFSTHNLKLRKLVGLCKKSIKFTIHKITR